MKKNIITQGNEIYDLLPTLNGDYCLVGQVTGYIEGGIKFKKIWDSASPAREYYAAVKFNGRTADVDPQFFPDIGSYITIFRVGDFYSAGNSGPELHEENSAKYSFLCLVPYKAQGNLEIPKYLPGYDFFYFGGWVSINGISTPPSIGIGPELGFSRRNLEYSYYLVHTGAADDTPYPEAQYPPGYLNRKAHFTEGQPKEYRLKFYRNYNGGANFSELVAEKIAYRYSGAPCLGAPRANAHNKTYWLIEDHPYDPPTHQYYVQVEEIMSSDSRTIDGIIGRNEYELDFVRNTLLIDPSYVGRYLIHKEDQFIVKDTVYGINRIDQNPITIKTDCVQFYTPGEHYHPNSTTYEMKKRSRKSGFYTTYNGQTNVPKYASRQWKLTLSRADVYTNSIAIYDNSTDKSAEESFNSDGSQFLMGNIDSGGPVPGTEFTAEYYTTTGSLAFDVSGPNGATYSRRANKWYKWNGMAWGPAAVGDSIQNLTAGDAWIGRARKSNTIHRNFALT